VFVTNRQFREQPDQHQCCWVAYIQSAPTQWAATILVTVILGEPRDSIEKAIKSTCGLAVASFSFEWMLLPIIRLSVLKSYLMPTDAH